jgi:hypothetical protein
MLAAAGALVWIEDMASQLTPAVVQQWMFSRCTAIPQLLQVWIVLAAWRPGMTYTWQFVLAAVQPGVLRLVQLLSSQAPMYTQSPAGGVFLEVMEQACVTLTPLCSRLLEYDWEQQLQRWIRGVAGDAGIVFTLSLLDSSGNSTYSGSSIAAPTSEQTSAMTQQQVRKSYEYAGVVCSCGTCVHPLLDGSCMSVVPLYASLCQSAHCLFVVHPHGMLL